MNHIGLNKDFKKMLSENAEFMALSLKEICTAADGTRKVEMIFLFVMPSVLLTIYVHLLVHVASQSMWRLFI